MPLRVAAISFLNPAPLLYNFEHEPTKSRLRKRYDVHYTSPATCAAQLESGEADMGLIPIAALTPALAVVPGCVIASRDEVRSILLLVKNLDGGTRQQALERVKTLAADAASRSSTAYASVLFQHFTGAQPSIQEHKADPVAMLAAGDAALLIGDPALLARERAAEIQKQVETPLLWIDMAALWREATGLPWVAAVWAVRPESLAPAGLNAGELQAELLSSRDAGLENINQLVTEWTPRIALPAETIRTYFTRNIYYKLDQPCQQAIRRFRDMAAEANILPPLPRLRLL